MDNSKQIGKMKLEKILQEVGNDIFQVWQSKANKMYDQLKPYLAGMRKEDYVKRYICTSFHEWKTQQNDEFYVSVQQQHLRGNDPQ